MAAAARDELRQEFIRADMGISGANFLVAETGTLVIITNEGNGRLCTSAPRVHVALAGMEKVVPSLEDLAVLLRLLPRSATGQRLTSYVSMVSGPKADEDVDGPEEFHLVLMDNGRTRLLADEVLREALNCLRCGACLNICPVYQKVGGHAYGWVYPGPIGAIITPTLVGEKQAKELPFASTLCGACRDACPVKIDIPRLLLHQRRKVSEGTGDKRAMSSWKERFFAWAFHFSMSHTTVLGLARRLGRLGQLPFIRKGVVSKVPLSPISQWTKGRDLHRLPGKTFKQRWEQGQGTRK
jgi:L-lactate dehydrogenase complex protein LldF